jgi:AcrR family transcriptional regulator
MTRRSYAKGVAKREEILTTALDVIATRGFNGATLRDLAEASGLSITGLVHHFGTKEELLIEVLRRRDEINIDLGLFTDEGHATTAAMIDELDRLVTYNASHPGLIALYSNLSVDAAHPEHPGHEYFRERYAHGRELGAEALRRLQDAGELPTDLDAAELATVITAAVDGLQILSLYDESLDMTRSLNALGALITRAAAAPASTSGTTSEGAA